MDPEILCQLCGVSFAIGRLRNAHEPMEASWDLFGQSFVEWDTSVPFNNQCGPDTGCVFPARVDHDVVLLQEHIAGPGCSATSAYNGNRITVQEMKGCRIVRCLAKKKEGWQAEDDDQDFELESDYFLTGLGDGSPFEDTLRNIKPARHDVSEIEVYNLVSTPNKMSNELHTERLIASYDRRRVAGLSYDLVAGYTIPPDVLRNFQKGLAKTARQSGC